MADFVQWMTSHWHAVISIGSMALSICITVAHLANSSGLAKSLQDVADVLAKLDRPKDPSDPLVQEELKK